MLGLEPGIHALSQIEKGSACLDARIKSAHDATEMMRHN